MGACKALSSMQLQPFISIVVPVYNVAPYIGECLESIVSQGYENMEVDIVDDASNDDTAELCRKFIEDVPHPENWRLITHTRNLGVSVTRNDGIAAAHGDYILCLDGDDILPPGALTTLTAALANKEAPDVVVGNHRCFGLEETGAFRTSDGNYDGAHIIISNLERKWFMTAWNKLVRRALLTEHRIKFPEGLIHEDEYWAFALALHAKSICVLPDVTYHYRRRPGSLTTTGTPEYHRGQRLAVLRHVYAEAKRAGLPYDTRFASWVMDFLHATPGARRWTYRQYKCLSQESFARDLPLLRLRRGIQDSTRYTMRGLSFHIRPRFLGFLVWRWFA